MKSFRDKRRKIISIRKLSEYEKGWLAGIIDSDGHLYFGRPKSKKYKNWRISVEVSNINLPFLEKIREIIGYGSINIYSSREKKGYSPAYNYKLTTRDGIEKLLCQLTLIVKETQRKLLLEAIGLLEERKNETNKRLFEINRMFRQLNQKKKCQFWNKKESLSA
jgi:hypothetical protein